jgi:hypothetical protein
MIHLSTSLKYYKREDVQKALVEHGKGKEVAARFNDRFGRRPDTLTYPNDVMEMAKNGATSFHCSEELWTNPLLLKPQMPKKEFDELRKGWDLILDIDTDVKDETARMEYSKMAGDLIVKELKRQGVKSVTAKFSGNKGFHIAVPYEAFPSIFIGKETQELFPDAPKRIAGYLKERITETLGKRIVESEYGDYTKISEKTGKAIKEFAYMAKIEDGFDSETEYKFNAEPFLEIDTLLISSRHMYRMPYSMHEKSGLISIPIDCDNIMEFSRDSAKPEGVVVGEHPFLDRGGVVAGEGSKLLVEAYDFDKRETVSPEGGSETKQKYYDEEERDEKVGSMYFPDCIKKILDGVVDGRKRALFVLINFLTSCNWSYDEAGVFIKEWNNKNKEPLSELQINSQLNYNKMHKNKILPPNCSNATYYKELGIECTPRCGRCKNPVAEAKYLYRRAKRTAPKKKKLEKTQ